MSVDALSPAPAQAAAPTAAAPLLVAADVHHQFGRREDWFDRIGRRLRHHRQPTVVKALNGVDVSIQRGEIFGIAGESGCGKSTLGRILVGLLAPSRGTVSFNGRPVARKGRPVDLRLQMIFQDAGAALNPRLTVRDLIGEGPVLHRMVPRRQLRDFVASQLEQVGLTPDVMDRYPHQFSVGQRQRINIARALALQPEMIVCDESIAALDVSIQAQIINLFLDLKDKLGLTYVFISHDLGVLRYIADRIAVMYLGRVVEQGAASSIFEQPRHPYTRVLLDNVPRLDRRRQLFSPAAGEVPSPINLPAGCAFHTRCPMVEPGCLTGPAPELRPAAGHRFACPVVAAQEHERRSDGQVA
jgi:peptide/nickel transport system ATP-binding protein